MIDPELTGKFFLAMIDNDKSFIIIGIILSVINGGLLKIKGGKRIHDNRESMTD